MMRHDAAERPARRYTMAEIYAYARAKRREEYEALIAETQAMTPEQLTERFHSTVRGES